MRTIHKQQLQIADTWTYLLPMNAKIIHIAEQNGKPMMWYIFDANEQRNESRLLRTYGTGHLVADNGQRHLGTVVLTSMPLVLHVFEVMP